MEILKNMHVFVEVAKANSFRRAGDALGIPNSTVSRRIAELERSVGLRLFNRSTRRVELTEGGRLYFENCKRIIREAELAHLELTNLQTQPSGVIRASMPVDFSVMFLSPLLTEFSRRHPNIQFDLDISPKQVDLMTESIDLAIRIGQPKDINLIARQIAKFESLLVASPDYLRSRGVPKKPEDLQAHDCLRINESPWMLSHRDGRSQNLSLSSSFIANNKGLLHQLALRGQGIIQSSMIFAKEDLERRRLVQVLPDWTPPPVQVFAITTTRLLPAKVRFFINFLSEKLANENFDERLT